MRQVYGRLNNGGYMKKELIKFLIRAKRNTYAGKGAENTISI